MKFDLEGPCALCLPMDSVALGAIMPLHLWIWPDGTIRAVGPTLAKLFPGQTLPGQRFTDLFTLQRPSEMVTVDEFSAQAGGRLRIAMKPAPHTSFKGMVVPLKCGMGMLLNLSFGIAVADAVRDHHLTDADFAPTDLTVEMLFLVEAKSAVMSELRSLNDRLQLARSEAEQRALTDTLTGLKNRRAMDSALAGASAASAGRTGRAVSFGLMHVDLDHFKEVNDTLGHAAGDHVLTEVAAILREETRAVDTVARVGGDEFVLVLPGVSDTVQLDRIARRILARIEVPIAFAGRECRLSASIGITSSEFYSEPEPDRLLRDADRALYVSKYGGRAQVTIFQNDMPKTPCANGMDRVPV